MTMFEFEYCSECHGDEDDHDVLIFLNNPFYRCKPNAQCHVINCQEHA